MRKRNWGLLLILLALFLVVAGCGSNDSSSPPANENQSTGQDEKNTKDSDTNEAMSNIIVGTDAAGSAFHSIAAGVASVVNDHAPFQLTLSTYAGPDAWLPLMNENEVHLGIVPTTMATWAYRGESPFTQAYKNIRTVVRGELADPVALVVRTDSGIETVQDLKGKRITSDFGAHKTIGNILTVSLELAGLSWDDVIPVPVTSYQQGLEALRDNQVDAAFGGSPTTSIGMEVDSTVGITALNFGDIAPDQINDVSDEVIKRVQEFMPGGQFSTRKGGFVDTETTVVEYPDYLTASLDLPEDIVYEITKIIWDNYEELHPIYPLLAQWVPENMFDPTPTIPYHDGAIRYYKEVGLWTDEAEQYHQQLINQ